LILNLPPEHLQIVFGGGGGGGGGGWAFFGRGRKGAREKIVIKIAYMR
jgi:hypothetical protein